MVAKVFTTLAELPKKVEEMMGFWQSALQGNENSENNLFTLSKLFVVHGKTNHTIIVLLIIWLYVPIDLFRMSVVFLQANNPRHLDVPAVSVVRTSRSFQLALPH